MNIKFLAIFSTLLFISASAFAEREGLCQSYLTYQAKEIMAAKMSADDDDIELVKYSEEKWTEGLAENEGTVLVSLVHNYYAGEARPATYANVRINAKQIGASDKCKIEGAAITFAK